MTLKEKLGLDTVPVFLMDGTAFIYRSFYANSHLRRSDGFPTGALAIVTRVLLRVLRRENPEYFIFLMDGRGATFRNAIYERYKANRDAMPEDLACQVEPIRRMARALGLPTYVASGMEADDCIASLAARTGPLLPVAIVSGDKDLKQCLGPNTFMWDPGAREERILTESDFRAESGVPPARWPDVQALIGDASDNIPGVPGIGPKTAGRIFAICPSLEDIRDHFNLLPPKIQEKLREHLDKMFVWRELARLRLDACPELGLADLRRLPVDMEECAAICDEYELAAARREIAALARETARLPDGGARKPGAGAEAAAMARAREISLPQDLPACKGMAVGIVWPDGPKAPPRLAVAEAGADGCLRIDPGQREYFWLGGMAELCQWLEAASLVVVADLKSLMAGSSLWRSIGPACFDLGLASYLLNPDDGDYSWPMLAASRQEAMGMECGPAVLSLAMAGELRKKLAANGLLELYNDMEAPLTPVLAGMEEQGIAIEPLAFQSFLEETQAALDSLTARLYAEAGGVFNLRSSQQLGEVLFQRLGLHAAQKTKGGQPSTSQAALEKLAGEHPLVDGVLQFRKLDKMRSTYLAPLPRLMDANGRLHTTFNQEATATGRLSSSNPNLQNIPVRGDMGKRMRACFVAGPGKALAAADYSQIELRILAHLSQDRNLLEAFRNGEDIHARTAALVFDLPREEIQADQRRMAKTINFGLLYGMGARKLAQELKISQAQARDFIDRYFERLSGLGAFYEKIVESAREYGYVATMAGRKRWLPGIFSANGQTAAQARRQAINTVIQGSAADVIKLAMLACARDQKLNELGARLVLQVHDELLLEAPAENVREAGARAAALMEAVRPGGVELSAPLRVDWGVGQNWGEAH